MTLDRSGTRLLASSCGTRFHIMEPVGNPLRRREPHVGDAAPGTQAVDRAADLVATVVHADEPLTFADLQDASGLAKSTTSRMLTALERTGLLERDARRHLRRRPALLAVRRPARPVGGAGPAGPPDDGGDRRGHPRDRAPERRPRRPRRAGGPGRLPLPARHPRLDRGRRARPLLGARQGVPRLGRARGPARARSSGPRPRRWPLTAALQRDWRRAARERGWAVTVDELEVGLTGVAVPVHGARGDVVAALGVSGPTPRLEDRLDELGRSLLDHATQLLGAAARTGTTARVQQEGVA